jgi:glycosyltransferase involved in cell wall biosynthesis
MKGNDFSQNKERGLHLSLQGILQDRNRKDIPEKMDAKKLKIILDCDLMKHPHSGLYHYCLNLGEHMQKLIHEENAGSISFYVPSAEKNTFGTESKTIVEKKSIWNLFNPFLRKCNIWHAPFQSGRIVPDKRKHPGIKVLLTIHDLNCLYEDKTAKERRTSLEQTQKLVDRSDALVCISHHCKKDVISQIDTGNKPVHVIHNGTHHITVPPEKPSGYMPVIPFLFTMGYVNPKKNFHTLVPLLKNSNLELVIAGRLDDPDYISNMKKQAEAMGVNDRLKMLGPVSEEDKAWYLNNCEAFLLPSLAEGFGAPVVEAMAFGKPVFLSNRTSLPEIGGDVAFYFESFEADHMQQVLKTGLNEYKKNGLSYRIISRGNEFNWELKAKEYLRVYRSLLTI